MAIERAGVWCAAGRSDQYTAGMIEEQEPRLSEPDDRLAGEAFSRLVGIMRRLRGPEGCPWDREQDFSSLRRYTLEEAYEVVQAIDDGDPQTLSAELGDLLLQIVFLSQLGAEDGSFTVVDAIESISDKLVRRHPHVFGDLHVNGADDVLRNWEAIKHEERGTTSLLDDVPRAFPALERAQKIGKRAAQMSFDWASAADVVDKVREEIDELAEALQQSNERQVEELGDLLLTLTSLARHLGHSAEIVLNDASRKFERRFRKLEAAVRDGRVAATTAELEAEWLRIKAGE